VGVIPVRARPVGNETVGEPTSDRHGILSHTRYAVHGIGNINSMPVQGDPIGDRFVAQVHLDQVALRSPDLRAG
jgi:hypothetical protein